ncbi:Dna2/Cas4 domain-containing protein [Chitinophaga varians]|uniref:Dna2/Cas4 domain-containing protein n=1 Tax=Chitinophaga varians TaxID=2202339 RepID=A0A847S0G6_9BACT|nr:CRISPR-associated protein Cas4 [Chitinophaga varians]NLR66618.1 Dna2/Cas4 domain-containing protein [Chitinophaga varians]
MNITGTHVAYLHTCKRKLWLFANGIQMEYTSDIVADGKLVAETTYLDRSRKYTELAIDGIKIDFFNVKDKIVHEVKKSDKVEVAHVAQLKYYLSVLVRNGIVDPKGVIEYPRLKQKEYVEWNDEFLLQAKQWEDEICLIVQSDICPSIVKKGICKSCSYYELCYIAEV